MKEVKTSLWKRKKDNNMKEMIRIARNLFEKKGYQETSIMELCKAVKISKTTFFNYFGSKDELVNIIFHLAYVDTEKAAKKKAEEDGTPVEVIKVILSTMIEDVNNYSNLAATAFGLMMNDEDHSVAFKIEYTDLIVKYVTLAEEQNLTKNDISTDTIVATIMGTFYSIVFAKGSKDGTKIMDEVIGLLFKD